MSTSSSHWSGSPKAEISASRRDREGANRGSRLQQHNIHVPQVPGSASRPPNPSTRPLTGIEQRDPLEIQRGLDVQILSDSAYDRLFPSTDAGSA